MARSTRGETPVVFRMNQALNLALTFQRGSEDEAKCLATARGIGDRFLLGQQNLVLDWVARADDTHRSGSIQGASTVAHRRREHDRAQLFKLTQPEPLLAPANIVAVFLRDQPMWGSWSWSDTEAVNAMMLPVAKRFNPNAPPSDPRLALPFTVAGFMLYRAFHLGPARRRLNFDRLTGLWFEVYREVADGVRILDSCLSEAARLKVNGEAPAAFLEAFADAIDDAETLLLHAIRLGPGIWNLILECPLGAECRKGTPYYVVAPARKDAKPVAVRVSPDDWHLRCRVAKTRASKGRKAVTVTRRQKKKTR